MLGTSTDRPAVPAVRERVGSAGFSFLHFGAQVAFGTPKPKRTCRWQALAQGLPMDSSKSHGSVLLSDAASISPCGNQIPGWPLCPRILLCNTTEIGEEGVEAFPWLRKLLKGHRGHTMATMATALHKRGFARRNFGAAWKDFSTRLQCGKRKDKFFCADNAASLGKHHSHPYLCHLYPRDPLGVLFHRPCCPHWKRGSW